MDKETKELIEDAVEIIAGSTMAAMAVMVAASVIESLVVSDIENHDVTGKEELHPTQDKTTVSSVETAAEETEGKLSHDKVAGSEGAVKAEETEARAAAGEATAEESGATALRTKAGASDIETKALKMT